MQHLTFIIKGINQNIWNLWTKPWTQTQTGNTLYPFRSKSFGHAQFWGTKWFAKNWSAFISRDIWKYEGGMTKVSINFQIHYLISGKVWHFFRNVENKFLVRVFILLLCYTKVIKSGNNTTPPTLLMIYKQWSLCLEKFAEECDGASEVLRIPVRSGGCSGLRMCLRCYM